MKAEFGNYQIITDERQFIVQQKKVVRESKMTKKENVGKEYWDDVAYYGRNLNLALKYIGTQIVLDNDDLSDIKRLLSELQNKIDKMTELLEIRGVRGDES